MREFDRIGLTVPEGSTELIDKRCPISKTHRLPTGDLYYQTANSLIHFGNGLNDIDLEPVDNGDSWLVINAPYKLEVRKNKLEYTYASLDGSIKITMQLMSIDGKALPKMRCVPCQTSSLGHSLSFNQVLGDGDVSVVTKPNGVSTQQVIKSAKGRRTLVWKVTQNVPNPIVLETHVNARDANNAECEVTIVRSALTPNPDGTYSGTFSEHVTGKILVILDPKTRIKTPADGLVYPVIMVS